MGSNARSASYPAVLAGLFQGVVASNASWFGDANAAGDGKTLPQYDSRVTMGSGWVATTNNTTVGHYAQSQQSGLTTTLGFTPGVEFDRIRVYYAEWSGSPEYTVNIGGSTIATLNMDRAGAIAGTTYEDITCTLGTNPVNIVATGDWGSINGCYVYKSSVKQVTVINGGWWGVYSGDYAADANGWQPIDTIGVIAPDLSIVNVSGNDAMSGTAEATLKANLRIIIDACKATGSVLVTSYPPVNPTIVSEAIQQTYNGYVHDVALEKEVAYLDFWTRPNWTSYAAANAAGFKDADGIHNTGTGYADLAQALWELVETQVAVPISDVSDGAWTPSTGADNYATIDEAVPSDTDYDSVTSASTFEVAVTVLTDPATGGGHYVRYRVGGLGDSITVRLRQGTTTIASWTDTDLTPTPRTVERYLTTAEANSITDYTVLRLQFEAL